MRALVTENHNIHFRLRTSNPCQNTSSTSNEFYLLIHCCSTILQRDLLDDNATPLLSQETKIKKCQCKKGMLKKNAGGTKLSESFFHSSVRSPLRAAGVLHILFAGEINKNVWLLLRRGHFFLSKKNIAKKDKLFHVKYIVEQQSTIHSSMHMLW